jgi:hypothetical protein
MENVRGTQGMTISGTEAVKKIWNVCQQKMAVSKSKSPYFYFSTDLLLLTAIARIFLIAVVKLLA